MTSVTAAFLAGSLFAIGLGVGGMTQPARVLGFLDVAGPWDPTLAFVMAGAVGVYATLFRLIRRRRRPLLAPSFAIPTRRDVDWRLVTGATLFGIGWGLAGYCPGPAIASLASGNTAVLAFVLAMVVGMAIVDALGSMSLPVRAPGHDARLGTQEGTG